MLIKSGYKHKKVFGIKRRVNASVFSGTVTLSGDFSLDPSLSNPNQNLPNPQWDAPAYPEGCTYYTTVEVCQDADKVLYSPIYQGENSCFMENQPMGSPVDITDALNTPTVYGLQGFGEPTNTQALTRKRIAQEVQPINGSLYQGILQALQSGQSVSYFGTWYESWDTAQNSIVGKPEGETTNHNWKFCGVKGANLIGKPLLGWFSYFPQSIVDTNGGQAFVFVPGENTELVVYEAIVTTLIKYLQRLVSFGGFTPVAGNNLFEQLEDEIESISNHIPSMEEKVYECAKLGLGEHLTLNEAVPDEVGCAEAVSYVLRSAGIDDGEQGIAGTAQLYDFLVASPHFTKIDAPEAGAVICSPTGQGNGLIEGHVGIFGAFNVAFPNDWGIMSNDSASGLFKELWSWKRWQAYYGQAGGLPLDIFRPI